MYPHERSLVSQLKDKPFALIGINSDSDREKALLACKKNGITWRSFWNGPDSTDGPISNTWQVTGWPTIHVLDGNGKIRFKNIPASELDSSIELLLAEIGEQVEIKNEH